jgi:hypothetical protein
MFLYLWTGYIYDVKTGKINEVAEATKVGKAA